MSVYVCLSAVSVYGMRIGESGWGRGGERRNMIIYILVHITCIYIIDIFTYTGVQPPRLLVLCVIVSSQI